MNKKIIFAGITIIGLNLFTIFFIEWKPIKIIYSFIVFISILPILDFISNNKESSPFFSLISLIYGIYYGLIALFPFEPYYTVAYVSEESLLKSSIYSVFGLLIMQICYKIFINKQTLVVRNNYLNDEINNQLENRFIIIGIIGTLSWFAKFILKLNLGLDFIIWIGSELLYFSIACLYCLQILKSINLRSKFMLWGVFSPVLVFLSLSTGLLYPVLRLILLIFMINLYVFRKIPIKSLTIAFILIIPLFVMKAEFRKIENVSNREKFSNVTQLVQRFKLYNIVIQEIKNENTGEILKFGLNSIASRIDLSHTFAYVIDYTPSNVPYLMGNTYSGIIWKFVPRIIHSNKPKENWGNIIGHKYGWLDYSDDDTSVNVPQLIEMYINFGPVGVGIGMGILGFIYAILCNFFNSPKNSFRSIIGLFILSSLFLIESNFTLIFGGILYFFIIFPLILKILFINFNNKILINY